MATRYESISNSLRKDDSDATPDGLSSDHEGLEQKDGHVTNGSTFLHQQSRPWLATLGMQVVALLWLAPIIALLYLNFTEYIIGQSAWCPGSGSCSNGINNVHPDVAEQNMLRYNKQDHDLLAGLQLVAKALELWFVLIALWFVYLMTMILAGTKEGLPVEYLTRAYRLAELWENFKPRTWTSLSSTSLRRGRDTTFLWTFVVLTVIISILAALMGPATAVLVLPTQQWFETPYYTAERFETWNSASPPSAGGYLLHIADLDKCSPDQILGKRWSCRAPGSNYLLDYWLSTDLLNTAAGLRFSSGLESFSANQSGPGIYESNVPWWLPNRQLVRNFTYDGYLYNAIQNFSTTREDLDAANAEDGPLPQALYEQYIVWQKALRLEGRRYGPLLALTSNTWPTPRWVYDAEDRSAWIDYPHTITVDERRQVRCYDYWALQNDIWQNFKYRYYDGESIPIANNYTRCIQLGSGWGQHTKMERFTIEHPLSSNRSDSLEADAEIRIYSSDRVAFLPNGTVPEGMDQDCILYDSPPEGAVCDWDTFFAVDDTSLLANISRYSNTVEMQAQGDDSAPVWARDYIISMNFTQYSYDPSIITNSFSLIKTDDLPSLATAIPVDPNWLLATWTVDANGSLPFNRSSALRTILLSKKPRIEDVATVQQGVYTVFQDAILASLQYMSTLIDYNTTKASELTAEDYRAAETDPMRPMLTIKTRYLTWAYSMKSRSSVFGTVIVIAGMLIAVLHIIMVGVDRRQYRSLTDMLASALEHVPQGEFHGLRTSKQLSKVRFRMEETSNLIGGLSFMAPVENHTRRDEENIVK